jgi:nitroimidazol reductase NimA-like FMN-containing flavoprotein (pyridoxamine 5'-phosphate oxidase superfamily)
MRQTNAPSMSDPDPVRVARGVIDANAYMTLATADGDGRPWASPVWFAHHGYTKFYWVSRPDARHSRNLAVRPHVAIVIFDSTVTVGEALAIYIEAEAEQLSDAEQEHAIDVYSRRSQAHGAGQWTTSDVSAPASHRLYRATASTHFLLVADDRRMTVRLDRWHGRRSARYATRRYRWFDLRGSLLGGPETLSGLTFAQTGCCGPTLSQASHD